MDGWMDEEDDLLFFLLFSVGWVGVSGWQYSSVDLFLLTRYLLPMCFCFLFWSFWGRIVVVPY